MKDARKQKQLQSQLSILQADCDALKIEIAHKQRELNLKNQQAQKLKDEIKKLDSPEVLKVSEHAIIRYLERVKGIDVSVIEGEILSESLSKMVETLGGNGTYPVNGFQVVLKNYTVATVI